MAQDVGLELRTPLTSLRTNVTLLARIDELDQADRLRVLDDLAGETRELTTLVNEIIDLGTDTRSTPSRPRSLWRRSLKPRSTGPGAASGATSNCASMTASCSAAARLWNALSGT